MTDQEKRVFKDAILAIARAVVGEVQRLVRPPPQHGQVVTQPPPWDSMLETRLDALFKSLK